MLSHARPNDGIDEGITDVLIAEKWLALQNGILMRLKDTAPKGWPENNNGAPCNGISGIQNGSGR